MHVSESDCAMVTAGLANFLALHQNIVVLLKTMPAQTSFALLGSTEDSYMFVAREIFQQLVVNMIPLHI